MAAGQKRYPHPQARWDEVGRYSDRYIAFIDILGFAALIDRSTRDPTLPMQLFRALELGASASPAHGPPSYPDGLSYAAPMITNFSDSIVVSAEGTPHGLMTVLEISRAFACLLLQYGLLTRGGVAGGPLLHESNVIFGPAMVSAYRLESQTAKVARIILADDCLAVCQAERETRSSFGKYFEDRLRVDTDGLTYLHVLRELEADALQGPGEFLDRWWGAARATVEAYLETSKGKSYRDKVIWFADYYDRCLADAARDDAACPWLRPFHAKLSEA
jgi:hypothetical protein